MQCFRLPDVGAHPTPIEAGFSSTGDGYPFRSTRFMYPIVNIFLTEKDESILINRSEDGSDYEAYVPQPWALESDRKLINFNDLGEKGPHDPMAAEITGTMANHDLLVRLYNKKVEYCFMWGFDRQPQGWVRAAGPGTQPTTTTRRSTTAKSAAATLPIGDQIKVTLLKQQVIGVDAWLLTVLAEAPKPDGHSKRKAYYYFVANSEDGSYLAFVQTPQYEDRKTAEPGPSDDMYENATGKLVGSSSKFNGKLSLTIGGKTVSYGHGDIRGKWVRVDQAKAAGTN